MKNAQFFNWAKMTLFRYEEGNILHVFRYSQHRGMIQSLTYRLLSHFAHRQRGHWLMKVKFVCCCSCVYNIWGVCGDEPCVPRCTAGAELPWSAVSQHVLGLRVGIPPLFSSFSTARPVGININRRLTAKQRGSSGATETQFVWQRGAYVGLGWDSLVI